MRIRPYIRRVALGAWLAAAAMGASAFAQTIPEGADPTLLEEGRFLATAGDCAGCHGLDLAGGDPVASPMGPIYASNITPDDATGIGVWTQEQFRAVLREGKAPDRHIFPAMPYTAYTGMTDAQIDALYAYLMMDVAPVAKVAPETDLPFPFVRPAMIAWNALFLDEGQAIGAVPVTGTELERGRMLVETLGHCSACHTPRGQLMQPIAARHLGGAMLDGWWAPNITTGPGGIGDWSEDRLAAFLMTGHTDVAVAAGEMSKVVSRSLSHLPRDDIYAMIAYLAAVPPVASQAPDGAPPEAAGVTPPLTVAQAEGGIAAEAVGSQPWAGATDDGTWSEMLGHGTSDGATLYQSACASCHGIDGQGSAGLEHPSLRLVGGVAAPQAATLVQVIANGVDRSVGDTHVLMPAFRDSLDDTQIAALATYVRARFGGIEDAMDAGRVSAILAGGIDTPWLIANAHWLAIAGLAIAALVFLACIAWAVRAIGRRRAHHA